MVMTWTAVFTLPGMNDTPGEAAQARNGLVGARLYEALRAALASRGWAFGEAYPEDHGWHGGARVDDDGKSVVANLVTCPEDVATAAGGASDDRWRVVIGMDLGMFPQTKARRTARFRRLAGDIDAACQTLGARDLIWEVGGP